MKPKLSIKISHKRITVGYKKLFMV